MDEVPIKPRPIEPFARIIGEERARRFADELAEARARLSDATVWHVNSTAAGGGVAEMLQSVLSYPAAADIRVRWLVIEGNEPFFELTKRIHHLLHGSRGDDGPLGEDERRLYEHTLNHEEDALTKLVRPGDVVILHDPQVLGLTRCLAKRGAAVIWSCHIGADTANQETRRAWDFLLPYVGESAAQTFSRPEYRWEHLAADKVAVMPPCIDAFATKNGSLDAESVTAVLDAGGVIRAPGPKRSPQFLRQDGATGSVTRRARMIEEEPLTDDVQIVCQISRWDPLKDHVGLMRAFVSSVPSELRAHLLLAGPSVDSVSDDPESQQTFEELAESHQALPRDARRHVHICALPMDDLEENAAIVNAIQRRSDVIVQKSLAEGFGLTVAEAMWKARPVLGSRVGGIQDQIEHGESGLLIDPTDPDALGSGISSLLTDHATAARLGESARRTVIERYLAPSYLTDQLRLVRQVLQGIS